MIANNYAHLQKRISMLIDELHDENGLVRQKARLSLINIGWDAVAALIDIVSNEKGSARWEAIEALGRIKDPSAAPVLVDAMLDDDINVHWAASNALVELDRAGIKPLLQGLTRHFDSVSFRESAHHVLHALMDRSRLLPKEIEVFEALEGVDPEVEAPWAAQAALEDINIVMNSVSSKRGS